MSTPPYQVEDQTDEDFFDRLVGDDDDFGMMGSQSNPEEMARVEFISEGENKQEDKIFLTTNASERIIENVSPVDTVSQEIGCSDSSIEKSGGSKVKEVQWSAFYSDSKQLGNSGFGSYSDFLTDNLEVSTNQQDDSEFKSGFVGNSGDNSNTYMASSEQKEAQFYISANGQVADANSPQDWENLYPGWKYDTNTGQWYQIDDYGKSLNTHSDGHTAALHSQSDNHNAAVNEQSGGKGAVANTQLGNHNAVQAGMEKELQNKTEAAVDGFVLGQRLNVSYLQQTSKPMVNTVSEGSTTSSIANWNQVSQGNIEFPRNMVFDPQYPEWYYDTCTQQWYTLDSYYQTFKKTAGTVQGQLTQNASNGPMSNENSTLYGTDNISDQNALMSLNRNKTGGDWHGSVSKYAHHNLWQPEAINESAVSFAGNQQIGNSYGLAGHEVNYTDKIINYRTFEPVQNNGNGGSDGVAAFQSFLPSQNFRQFNQPKMEQTLESHLSQNYYGNQNSVNYPQRPLQVTGALTHNFSHANNEGRSSAGRPPHALVTFGFGGKLIIMKDSNSFSTNLDYRGQDTAKGVISVLSLFEVVKDNIDDSSIMGGGCSYFHALCQQSFPGPLVGGNAGTKDVNKCIDEKVQQCQSPMVDQRKGELLKLLLSLLKISCHHYGKLRSPFSTESSLEDTDGPELDVTKLFASAKRNGSHIGEYGLCTQCMQNIPSEGQIQTTAVEVQNLLVFGRRKEALQCAQKGQLWGPALVLAAQLGEKFYVDTVKQMAHCQLISGSPLRTLCLLIAGQPADIFSADDFTNNSLVGAVNTFQQPREVPFNGMLDDWEKNLAILTANRTKDDALVIIHLGDCLWKERGEVTAAHTCYLVAEANVESYSDSARLCLIGADHWKFPRTYVSPEAIQRTELYEYSKVLGNSQFVLLPFQPYKIIYAYMLAEVGKVSDALRYCQASLKLLKNSGRAPEVDTWKSVLSSLEERLRTHQQGGYGTNLAPAKFVGKLFTSIDRSIHRMMGSSTAPLPPMPQTSPNGRDSNPLVPKVSNSQSTMAMSSLIPSASVEGMDRQATDSNRKIMHNRSISEPDFGRSPIQDLKDSGSADAESKASASRIGRIGSQIFQKTMGWVSRSRPDHQAKLGESNKFYYDEKLKRWVEEGTEPPAEEVAFPPPPTIPFQNGMSDYSSSSAFTSHSLTADGGPESKASSLTENSSGMPPIAPVTNQFSARSRMGVRSRYVDTFNKSGGGTPNSFQSPTAPSIKPAVGAEFFVPTVRSPSNEQPIDANNNVPEVATNSGSSTPVHEAAFPSPTPSMQRFPSMDNVGPFESNGPGSAVRNRYGTRSNHSRAASWSGGYNDVFGTKMTEVNRAGGLGSHSPFLPSSPSCLSRMSPQLNGQSFGDELHEVELSDA